MGVYRAIARYYNFGLTFRWTQGDSHVVVKRGYVVEGKAVLVLQEMKNPTPQDRPHDDVGNDQDTWLATIPVNPGAWGPDDAHLAKVATEWARNNPDKADWKDQPRRQTGGVRVPRSP